MIYEHITHTLPEGVGQHLYSRVRTPGRTLAWVRAGDIRRSGTALAFTPRWDGEGFRVLWDAAVEGGPAARRPLIEFAVRHGGHLRLLGEVELSRQLQSHASHAAREAERARRGWRMPRRR